MVTSKSFLWFKNSRIVVFYAQPLQTNSGAVFQIKIRWILFHSRIIIINDNLIGCCNIRTTQNVVKYSVIKHIYPVNAEKNPNDNQQSNIRIINKLWRIKVGEGMTSTEQTNRSRTSGDHSLRHTSPVLTFLITSHVCSAIWRFILQ
jgi:hypothetical protein